jgi:hypothetical protein
VSFSYFGFTKPCVHSIAFHSASIADGALALAARARRARAAPRAPSATATSIAYPTALA